MAHHATYIPSWAQRYVGEGSPRKNYEKFLTTEPRVVVPDNEWESGHMAWLGFSDTLAIGCGCQDCADEIYAVLSACAAAHGHERLP